MADLETSVVISAQIDGLRSGMEAASNSVQAATDAMRAQLAGLVGFHVEECAPWGPTKTDSKLAEAQTIWAAWSYR